MMMEIPKIPLGTWIQLSVGFLTSHFEDQFRSFSEHLSSLLEFLIHILSKPHAGWVILSVGVLIYIFKRNLKSALFSMLGLGLIVNLGYWHESIETLALVLGATVIAAGFGIPIGIYCARHPVLYRILQPILDLMQTIPTFVYLIPTLMLFGLGLTPGIISTVIFAMPAPIRLTYLGVSQVPLTLREVGDAFGSTRWRRLWDIEIPYALSSIRTGLSQCVMLSLSMVVIAALVGAEGLGKPVVQALNTVNIAQGFEAGITIVVLAIFLDRLFVSTSSHPAIQETT
jgi:glycine betaine/proline transport system permease protein